jgi:hypothetical protein
VDLVPGTWATVTITAAVGPDLNAVSVAAGPAEAGPEGVVAEGVVAEGVVVVGAGAAPR